MTSKNTKDEKYKRYNHNQMFKYGYFITDNGIQEQVYKKYRQIRSMKDLDKLYFSHKTTDKSHFSCILRSDAKKMIETYVNQLHEPQSVEEFNRILLLVVEQAYNYSLTLLDGSELKASSFK